MAEDWRAIQRRIIEYQSVEWNLGRALDACPDGAPLLRADIEALQHEVQERLIRETKALAVALDS